MVKGKSNAKESVKRRRTKVDDEPTDGETKSNPRRNLLCFDSGGVRSLSSLIILQRLVHEYEKHDVSQGRDPDDPRKPYEYFDMIGGTGTGGLIAIMLGRLKMDLDDCIDEFYNIIEKVFRDMDPENHPALTSKDGEERRDAWEEFATQNSQNMEDEAKRLVREYGGDENLLFFDNSESLCEVFVCSLVANTSGMVPLTSYETLRAVRRRLKNIKVWEAIKATTAVPTYFEPVSIKGDHYTEVLLSGEIGAANPVQILWNEGKRRFELTDPLVPADPLMEDEEGKEPEEAIEETQRDLGTLISIGSGLPQLLPFETEYHRVLGSTYQVVTDHESLADAFQHTNLKIDNSQRYHRLNVLQGIADIEFYDGSEKRIHDVQRASNNYVEKAEFLKTITRVVNITKHRPQRQTFDQIAAENH